jgi:hypothetical protein
MLLEEPKELTLKDKIIRTFVGIFMTILVGMLIITFIPNDAEQSLQLMLSGQDSHSAGKFGEETIPMDYFQAARKDCYSRYKDSPGGNVDNSLVISCAYSQIKTLKVSRLIAESVGFGISENRIKEMILEQAKQVHGESYVGAGYSEEDRSSLEDIYINILRSVPMEYRQDGLISYTLFQSFLNAKLSASEAEKNLKRDAGELRVDLSYVYFTDADLLAKVGDSIEIPEAELQKEYDQSVKAGTLPKNAQGEVPSFEERKAILYNKLKADKKQGLVAELKTKIQTLKNSDGKEVLKEIAVLTGSKIEDIKKVSLTELSKPSADSKFFRFASNAGFLKDFVEIPFGKGMVGGPYVDSEKSVYVEFKELKFEKDSKPNVAQEDQRFSPEMMKMYSFLEEINQSISARFPVYRKFDKQVE